MELFLTQMSINSLFALPSGQHVVALREQGFSQTAIAEYVGISHATVSRWLSNGTFPEQKPCPRSASVDPHLPQLVERWKAGNSTVAELHRELVANGYSHQYNSVYRRLARSFPGEQKKRYTRGMPSGQKKQEVADQLPQPPVLARQAMFLFLRRPVNPNIKRLMATLDTPMKKGSQQELEQKGPSADTAPARISAVI